MKQDGHARTRVLQQAPEKVRPRDVIHCILTAGDGTSGNFRIDVVMQTGLARRTMTGKQRQDDQMDSPPDEIPRGTARTET